jgi:hypothetical protein
MAATNRPGTAPGAPVSTRVKVRATKLGFHNNKRRRPGDVFFIDRAMVSRKWMEIVPDSTPLKQTNSPQAMKAEHDEILRQRVAGSAETAGEGEEVDDEVDPNPLRQHDDD